MGKNLKSKMSPERQAEVFSYFEEPYGFSLDLAEETQMKGLMEQYLFYDADERRFSIFRVAPDGGLMVISGWGKRKFSHNDLCPDIDFTVKERAYFGPGERMRWKRTWNYGELGCHGPAYPAGWDACEWMGEPFNPSMYTSDGSYFVICAERIDATKLKYCRLEDWYHDRCNVWLSDTMKSVRFVHKFLSLYTEYPNLEMACRLGFWKAVDDLVDFGRKNSRILDWSAKSTWGFLRLSKSDGKAFLKADCGMDELQVLAEARRWNKKLSLVQFWELLEQCGNNNYVTQLVLKCCQVSRLSPQKIIHYVSRDTNISRRAQMLADYLQFAKTLKYDLRQQDVALPKDLKERHDAAASAVAIIQATQRKFSAALKYAKRMHDVQHMYEFALEGLCIMAPLDPQDIVDEGKRQHHCVGGYAARHFDGKLEILFLRKAADPARPWITIEMAHREQPTGKVIIQQMYDAYNRHGLCHWKKEIGWFIDAWTDWLRAGSPRDKDGQPIIQIAKEDVA